MSEPFDRDDLLKGGSGLTDDFKNYEELHGLLKKDKLTKVATRAELEKEMSAIVEKDEDAAIMIVDIDKFKDINDTHGHLAGDKILSSLGDRLNAHIKDKDIVGRWGGEEFVVILKGNFTKEVLVSRAEELRLMVSEDPFKLENNGVLPCTISIGAAVRDSNQSLEDWFESADKALYQSKHNGRNQVTVAE